MVQNFKSFNKIIDITMYSGIFSLLHNHTWDSSEIMWRESFGMSCNVVSSLKKKRFIREKFDC